MEKNKVMVLAGIFAVSNMGQPRPGVNLIRRAIGVKDWGSPRNLAIYFAEPYMETNMRTSSPRR